MFKFENIEFLQVLWVIPMLIILFVLGWAWRKRSIESFAVPGAFKRLAPDFSRLNYFLKFILVLLAITAFAVALANPQWGVKKEKVKRKSADIFIALDISESMLAQDILPSRIDRAKRFTQNLVQSLKGERIGLILFAGNAYLQMPMTTDYSAAQLFIKSANTDLAPNQGTAISDAIDMAERSFEEDNKNHKALIIISDGENHDEEALQRATEANENGLIIFTVGVGTSQGAYMPVKVGNRTDYKRDETGNPVRSQLNEEMLAELAKIGDGYYFNINDSKKVLETLKSRIDEVEKREFEQRVFSDYESYFQYFIAIGILFLIIEVILSYKKAKWLKGKDLFEV